jgi:hypothetical protein
MESYKIWDDKVIGKPPLYSHVDLSDMRERLNEHNIHTLYALSKWDQGMVTWKCWKPLNPPSHLMEQCHSLYSILHGAAPQFLSIHGIVEVGVPRGDLILSRSYMPLSIVIFLYLQRQSCVNIYGKVMSYQWLIFPIGLWPMGHY